MVRGLFWTMLGHALLAQSHSQPVDVFPRHSFSRKTEQSWLWGWAWGAESTVSVVDRSPALSFPSRPAAFGAEIADPILGYVIPLSSFTVPCSGNESLTHPPPNWGCPDLCISGPYEPERTETWIAMVQRGKCDFVSKVREAQRLGANAVVVGGENPDISGHPDTLVNMYSPEDSSDVKIAATFIKYSDYMELSSLISTSNTSHSGLRTLSLLITAEYSAWEWYSPIITFIFILLLPSVLTFITLLIHRIRAARAAQLDRAPEDVVRNLPWRVWTGTGKEKHERGEDVPVVAIVPPTPDTEVEQGIARLEPFHNNDMNDDGADENDASTSHAGTPPTQPWFEGQIECAICLSEFIKGDKVRVLPCHHIFHLEEVDEWLIQRKKLCPVCKADVTQVPNLLSPLSSPEHPDTSEIQSNTASRPSSPGSVTERTPLLHDSSGRQA